MAAPGIVLSQPTSTTSASNRLPRATSSIESAITSRLTSDARMPGGAHRDAVGDRDGVELHRRAAGGANAVLDPVGQLAQMEIARTDLDPGVGHADERLRQILGGESDGAQHGARRRPAGAVGDRAALPFSGGRSSVTACLLRSGVWRRPLGLAPARIRSQRAQRIGANSARCTMARAHGRSSRAAATST